MDRQYTAQRGDELSGPVGVDLSAVQVTLPAEVSLLSSARITDDVADVVRSGFMMSPASPISTPDMLPPRPTGGSGHDDRRRIQFSELVSEGQRRSTKSPKDEGGGGGCGGSQQKKPAPARRKKSIRITLDDDRDVRSDPGCISTMLERKIRFEDSPTTPVTPLGSTASNETSGFDDKLRLLSVSDASTGMCLYRCTWNWRRNTNIDGVGSLVQSFFQFAREIGDGGLNFVSFELPGRKSHHKHTPRKRQSMAQRSAASMAVLSCRDTCCVVALFFDDQQLKPTDPDTEKSLRTYMEAVRARFTATYGPKVEGMRPKLKDLADGKNQSITISDIQIHFEDFETVVLALREQYLPEGIVTPPLSA